MLLPSLLELNAIIHSLGILGKSCSDKSTPGFMGRKTKRAKAEQKFRHSHKSVGALCLPLFFYQHLVPC